MSTHTWHCVVCDAPTACCNDEHVLGAGGGCYGSEPKIEFCSLECFNDLRERLELRRRIAAEMHPGWFPEQPTTAPTPEVMFTQGPLRDAARAGYYAASGDVGQAEVCKLAALAGLHDEYQVRPYVPPAPAEDPEKEGAVPTTTRKEEA